MENKKEYILNRWYPTLPNDWKTEHDYVYYKEESLMVNKLLMTTHIINFKHLEYRDFWEEVKQPLFVTEDGFKFFSETSREFYIVVNFIKYRSTISDFEDQKKLSHKVFYHESNADEYIAWYKKEFSINDLLLADVGITTSQLDKLRELAKERSEE